MLKIRLSRLGCKHSPSYKIVVTDSRNSRDGQYQELVGHYNPNSKQLKLDKDLYNKYIMLGAQPTKVVQQLFKKC